MLRHTIAFFSLFCLTSLAIAADPVPEWLWSSSDAKEGEVVYFRKSFDLALPQGSPALKSGWLIVTCDNHWKVFINGEKVSSGDDWQLPARADASKYLKSGKNVIAVEGKNDGGPAGLLVKLTVTRPDDSKKLIVSDSSWLMAAKAAAGWEKADFDDKDWKKVHSLGKLGIAPWGEVIAGQPGVGAAPGNATPAEALTTLPGFKAELLYSVPKAEQGSWVNMCFDNKGRIIVSNQNGILYRITVDKPEKGKVEIEPIEVRTKSTAQPIGKAHGLLYAFDSLYVMISDGGGEGNGLYRLRDTTGNDRYDSAELLRKIDGGGEHGPHAIRLGPDGKSLYIVAGNHTKLPKIDASRVAKHWDEDQLLPRMPDAGGHAVGIMAPGGWICKTDPDGKSWELICNGFRNPFDFDFNPDGELFTWDADMEWDIGLPWYRPTRLNHCVSGAEFGWRNGSGKWPDYYPDSLPATVNVGLGSPTGIEFGTRAKFPARYQQAMFGLDWTYGIIYAFHLHPSGSSYIAEPEQFLSGKPLPVTDMAFGPDGALYFTIGGRGTQSGLYRVTYVGKEPTDPVKPKTDPVAAKARELRHQIEAFHGKQDPKAIEFAWPYLNSPDRFIRSAARVAIEHQPVEQWQEKALAEKDPESLINIMVALARCGEKSAQPSIFKALGALNWQALTEMQRLELLRTYALAVIRMGKPDAEQAKAIVEKLDPHFPAASFEINRELSALLLVLDAPGAVNKTVALLKKAETPREQIAFAYNLRPIKNGWTPELRKAYFEWFTLAANYKGGNSLAGYIRNMKTEAVALLTDAEKKEFAEVLNAKPVALKPVEPPRPRPMVKEWSLEELLPTVEKGLTKRDFNRGRALFTAVQCMQCHRFDGEGGALAPDLTGLAGRFSRRDLLEKAINPSKAISDQYQSTVLNLKSGKQVTGRIVSEQGGKVRLMTDLLKPEQITEVDIKNIESREASKVSPMPVGLLNTMEKEEILDLIAYVLSGGDRGNAAYR
jgi:putative heme-binding domain-containing protein